MVRTRCQEKFTNKGYFFYTHILAYENAFVLLKELLVASEQQLQGRSFGECMELGVDCSLTQELAGQHKIKRVKSIPSRVKMHG